MISDGRQYIETCIWGVKYISMGTSEIRTTSQQRTVVPLPMCPLFGGSTVIVVTMSYSLIMVTMIKLPSVIEAVVFWDHHYHDLENKHKS